MEVDETQLDPSSQESGKRAADPAFCEAHGRAAPKRRSPMVLLKISLAPRLSWSHPMAPWGRRELSSGTFRVTETVGSVRWGRSKPSETKFPKRISKANLDKLALSLRTKCTRWLSNNKGWQQFWYCDPEATETTEAGGWIGSTVSG